MGWRIEESADRNKPHELHIYVDGELVEKSKSHSLRYLSSIADSRYKCAFNRHTKTGWRYQLNN